MKTGNRDLLVLVKDEFINQHQMQTELELLNAILFKLETVDTFCMAHEVFDVNRHKVIENRRKIEQIIRHTELKPFCFIINKN